MLDKIGPNTVCAGDRYIHEDRMETVTAVRNSDFSARDPRGKISRYGYGEHRSAIVMRRDGSGYRVVAMGEALLSDEIKFSSR